MGDVSDDDVDVVGAGRQEEEEPTLAEALGIVAGHPGSFRSRGGGGRGEGGRPMPSDACSTPCCQKEGLFTVGNDRPGPSLARILLRGPTRHVMSGCRWSLPAAWDVIEGSRAVSEES